MGNKLYVFILVNIFLQVLTSAEWSWEDQDPYFSTSEKPPRPTPTTWTTNSPSSTEHSNPSIRRCIKRCPSTSEYNPICGTDNVTYHNQGKLLCAKSCGVDVSRAHDGTCGNSPTTVQPPTPTTSTSRPDIVTPNPACFKKCPKTAEYNPLCGTDNRTYNNESGMKCAQQCGAQVQKRFDGVCGSPASSTTTRQPPRSTTVLPPNFRACIRQCIVSSDYQPVCASDGNTYDNESLMVCDASCGRNVQKVRNGAC